MTCGNDEDATLILIQIPLVSTRQQAQLRKLAVPMHLTIDQCADSVIACTRSWLLKTKTSFFGYENWSLPWYFGLLCFSYTLSGIVLLLTKRPNRQDLFPRNLYALLLIFIQAPLSFVADYLNMDQDSVFHVVDRFMALTCAILELWRIYDLLHVSKPCSAILYTSISLGGIFSFLRSQAAQAIQDRDNFVFFHNLWHIYPICTAMVALYDHYIFHVHSDAKLKKV